MTEAIPVNAESISPERHELICVGLSIHTMYGWFTDERSAGEAMELREATSRCWEVDSPRVNRTDKTMID
ncbi:MAG: hypothetical protein ACUVTD_04525 [Nitrososphaerales archaeon]